MKIEYIVIDGLGGYKILIVEGFKPSNFIAEYTNQVPKEDLPFASWDGSSFTVDSAAKAVAQAAKDIVDAAQAAKELARANNKAAITLSLADIDSINSVAQLKAIVKLLVEHVIG